MKRKITSDLIQTHIGLLEKLSLVGIEPLETEVEGEGCVNGEKQIPMPSERRKLILERIKGNNKHESIKIFANVVEKYPETYWQE